LTLRLLPKPEGVLTLLALFWSVFDAAGCVGRILASTVTPRCVELMDGLTLQALRDAGNPIAASANALLLIELDGPVETLDATAEKVGNLCEDASATDVFAASDAAQRDRLWHARRQMSHAVRRLARHKLSEDVAVPRSRLLDLLTAAQANAEREQ